MTAAHRAWSFLCAAFTAASLAAFASSARAEDWRWDSGKIEDKAASIVRFQTRFDIWVATYDRPDRACKVFNFDDVGIPPPDLAGSRGGLRRGGLRPAQGVEFPEEFFGCNSSNSDEVGYGAGTEVSFRVISPLHFTVGIDLIYTDPSSDLIKNQIVIAIPFGILLTSYEWTFRPILQPTLTPILYLTDDARDYTFGIDFGGAWRVADWADLSAVIGYKGSETVTTWNFQVALHPM